jgi:pimeloyl-ACP methyl ester carboxylesterase
MSPARITHSPQRLLLLPGLDGTEILFAPLLSALPDWLLPTVVTYPIDGRNGYEDLLPVALEAVRRQPDCHVLGWSFSGPLALRLAHAEPGRVRSVTLVASFVQRPLRWLGVAGPMLNAGVVGAVRTLRRLPIWLCRAPDDPLRRDKARIWQRVPARTLAARARAIRSVDARADLTAVQRPLLYLRSLRDRAVPSSNLEHMRALRPDLRVATLAGDHFALYADPAAAAAAIAQFVVEVEGEAGGHAAPG